MRLPSVNQGVEQRGTEPCNDYKSPSESSALERATTVSFLLFQDSGESPKKTQKPIVERRSVTSPALIPYFSFQR